MTDTPNLKLPYLLAAQSQKHVTHNEALRALDALVQLSVLDRNLATPPVSPVDGARYIVAASPTGAWAGQTNKIAAFQDAAWMFYTPKEGWLVWIADENGVLVYDGAGWAALPGGGGGGGVTDHGLLTGLSDDDHAQYHTNARGDVRYTPLNPVTLGVNATADVTNKFAVGSAASLFNHMGTGGHQIKINKASATDTASFLFQSGFSGRAELGTTGDDDFHFKVSADGTAWNEALVIDRATGRVTFPASDFDVSVFDTPGAFTWTKPVWASSNAVVKVFLLGGGGGGGSGRRGAASAIRCGGGGGGSAVLSLVETRADLLGATVGVTVGAGGTGGAAIAVDTTNGNPGTVGGTSLFGTYRALGGNFGAGGTATTGTGGAAAGVASMFSAAGMAGSAASTTGGAGVNAGSATLGVGSGGGSGGGITTANAVSNGGAGGAVSFPMSTATAAGGTAGTAGGNGGAGNVVAIYQGKNIGTGGGGGASSGTANAGGGGAGGAGAGGGGGGGASLNSFASGAGGAGGAGWVVVVTYR